MRSGAWLGLVAACLELGCGPKHPAKPPLLAREVTVYVAVTDQVAETDTGNIAAMVDALEADLRDAGRSVTIVAARQDERPPAARLELQVMGSDSGSAGMRGAGNLVGFFGGAVGAGSSSFRSWPYVYSPSHARGQFGSGAGLRLLLRTDLIEAGRGGLHQGVVGAQ
jgi:hypothetical protein